MALVGVRSIRDYVVGDGQRTMSWLVSTSPFNITAENVTLAAFTEAEVGELRRETETEARALGQVVRYLDHLGLDEGWLVMSDLRAKTDWDARLYTRTETVGARRVHVVGC